jgi:chromosome segregation ATPase
MAEENMIQLDSGMEEETEVEVLGDDSDDSVELTVEQAEPLKAEEEDSFEKAASSTQKRIDKLTRKMRTAEREREEALRYAQAVQKEADELKNRMGSLDQNYVNEYSERVNSQLEAAEREMVNAMDIGDTAKVVELQRKITALSIEHDRAAQAKIQQKRYAEQQAALLEQSRQQLQYQQQAQRPAKPDARAQKWAEENEWFGQDEAMTYAAFGIHKKLVESEGFDPQTDDYYNELNKRITEEFPHKFNKTDEGSKKRPAQAVASNSRSTGRQGSRKVRLSQSQVAIAKKLGVPLEEYAKYVKG